jgi:hypothetical protein
MVCYSGEKSRCSLIWQLEPDGEKPINIEVLQHLKLLQLLGVL